MDYNDVMRAAQERAARKRRINDEVMLTQRQSQELVATEVYERMGSAKLTQTEAMIFKLKVELIDYIVSHGLVKGFIFDGIPQQIVDGNIVLTADMIKGITHKMGYVTTLELPDILGKYLTKNDYVSDSNYVHTDNNFTNELLKKLEGIQEGAEVNKIIDVVFNGESTLDEATKICTIKITSEDIKEWYEKNPNTNAFTDALKEKLDGISSGAEVNRVDDVLVNDRSVLNKDKQAIITKEIVKEAYEQNPNTNAFTDDEKAYLDLLKNMIIRGIIEDIETLESDLAKEEEERIAADKAINLTISSVITKHNEDISAINMTISSVIKRHDEDMVRVNERVDDEVKAIDATISSVVQKHNEDIVKIEDAISEANKNLNAFKEVVAGDLQEINTEIAGIKTTHEQDIARIDEKDGYQDEQIAALKSGTELAISSVINKYDKEIANIDAVIGTHTEEISQNRADIAAANLTISSIQVQHKQDIDRIDDELMQQSGDIVELQEDVTKRMIESWEYRRRPYDFNVYPENSGAYRMGGNENSPINEPNGFNTMSGGCTLTVGYPHETSDVMWLLTANYFSPELYFRTGTKGFWDKNDFWGIPMFPLDSKAFSSSLIQSSDGAFAVFQQATNVLICQASFSNYSRWVEEENGIIYSIECRAGMGKRICFNSRGGGTVWNSGTYVGKVLEILNDGTSFMRDLIAYGGNGGTNILMGVSSVKRTNLLRSVVLQFALCTRPMTHSEATAAGIPYPE